MTWHNWFNYCIQYSFLVTTVTKLSPKWVRLAPNGTNPGIFSDQRQYILARWAIWCQSDPLWAQIWWICLSAMSELGRNCARFTPKGTILWLFKTCFSNILVHRGKMYWKLILWRLRIVQFLSESDIPGVLGFNCYFIPIIPHEFLLNRDFI